MRKAARVVIWFMLFVVLTLGVGLVVTPDVKGESPQPASKSELAKRLIVKVTGENNFGAGIIFGVRGGYLFIATANHVAQRGVKEVEFEFLRGVPLNVELIHSYPKLDLAVLRVNVQENRLQEAHVTLPFDQISDVSNINRGDAVYPVGHPEGEAWDIPLTPSTVKKAIAEEIHFEPACFPGNSGGGLFDEQWNLIGMVIRARARSCEAVSFERIRATLEDDWGLEVNREPLALGPTESPKVPEETPDQEPDTQEEEKQQKIAQLLKQADAYFERQWYTTPEETNAFDVYREVLKLDPTNEHAYRQIDKMAKFYKSRAEREVKQGRAEQAIQFYRKYLRVVPNDEEILDKVAELEKPTPIPPSTPTPLPEATPTEVPTPKIEEQPTLTEKVWNEPLTGMEFVWIEGGCFQMGSPETEKGHYSDEEPVHEVCVDGFWMGKTEVTNAQYRTWKADHDSDEYEGYSLNGDAQPVVYVNWEDAKGFAAWLTKQYKENPPFPLPGGGFRLPTEAEWEYACRAGTTTARFWGDDPNEACQYANVHDQTSERLFDWDWDNHECDDGYAVAAPVGQFQPNAFGLYDMLGNVEEWCEDSYHEAAYSKHQRNNPVYTDDESNRMFRGGSWYAGSSDMRCAIRDNRTLTKREDDAGFRLVRTNMPLSTVTPTEIPQPTSSQRTSLRSKLLMVSEDERKEVFGLDEKWRPLKYIDNDFEDMGDVLIDHATGLMWQKSGSDEQLRYQQAQAYIEKLNRDRFAGYDDWRLPTVDELISLLELEKQSNDLYINPIFDATQGWCWSVDKHSSGAAWGVYFDSGSVDWRNLLNSYYVRCVRSLKETSPGASTDEKEWTDPITDMEFVWIPAGCFQMGSPETEERRELSEGSIHEVCIDGFWMGKYEVTQAQWLKVMGENPAYFDSAKVGINSYNHPVEQVSWDEVQEFLRKLNAQRGIGFYRLPSEAEWEFACRADTQTAYSFGGDTGRLDEYAWYEGNSGGKTHPVGQLKPNAFGLYDMHGNVWEWCADPWHKNYDGAPSYGSVWESGGDASQRVLRGGSLDHESSRVRCATRENHSPGGQGRLIGFRLARIK